MQPPTVVDPRTSLALWLRAGRTSRRLTLDDVARITKINRRVLDKLESGQLDGLPADVFVRGFVRSFARCVGLDEGEALEKLGDCAGLAQPPPPVPPAPPMIEILPEPVVEVAAEPQPEPPVETKKKRSRKRPAGTTPPRSRRQGHQGHQGQKKKSTDAPVVEAAPVETAPVEVEPVLADAGSSTPEVGIFAEGSDRFDATASAPPDVASDATPWTPTMPPMPTAPSVPWRRPSLPAATAPVAPSLVIDDADPDRAEREQARKQRDDQRVSFLPPILLDREDRSQRQGGLTLAVIILLIAATLTLSYLMRRPTVSGDGVTMIDSHGTLA